MSGHKKFLDNARTWRSDPWIRVGTQSACASNNVILKNDQQKVVSYRDSRRWEVHPAGSNVPPIFIILSSSSSSSVLWLCVRACVCVQIFEPCALRKTSLVHFSSVFWSLTWFRWTAERSMRSGTQQLTGRSSCTSGWDSWFVFFSFSKVLSISFIYKFLYLFIWLFSYLLDIYLQSIRDVFLLLLSSSSSQSLHF